jgi:hypothetical protein
VQITKELEATWVMAWVHPCNTFANASRTVAVGIDGSLIMAYQGVMPKKASKTFTMSYKGL